MEQKQKANQTLEQRLTAELKGYTASQKVVVADSTRLASHLSNLYTDTPIIGGGRLWQWYQRKLFIPTNGKSGAPHHVLTKDREIKVRLFDELRVNRDPALAFQSALDTSTQYIVSKSKAMFGIAANVPAWQLLQIAASESPKDGLAELGIPPNGKNTAAWLKSAKSMQKEISSYESAISELAELNEEGISRLLRTLANLDPGGSVAAFVSWRPSSGQKLHVYLSGGTKETSWELNIQEDEMMAYSKARGFGLELHYTVPKELQSEFPPSPPGIIATGPDEAFPAAKTLLDHFLAAILRHPKSMREGAFVTAQEANKA